MFIKYSLNIHFDPEIILVLCFSLYEINECPILASIYVQIFVFLKAYES